MKTNGGVPVVEVDLMTLFIMYKQSSTKST